MAYGDLDFILSRTPVKDRERVRREYEEKWKTVLKKATKKEVAPKRRDGYALLEELDVDKLLSKAVRSIATFKSRSYNADKQLQDFIKHLFVKYPVPQFMYQCMYKQKQDYYIGIRYNRLYLNSIYRDWFVILAQGGSFQKAVKGMMTKKEAVMFLKGPSENQIHDNVWWAKMKILDIPDTTIKKLIEKIFTHYHIDETGGRLDEILHFFANNHKDINKNEFTEITDFIYWKMRNDPDFRFKGRTVTSMIKMSNEWHMQMQKAKLGQNVKWEGMDIKPWTYETKDHIWEVSELTSNKDLLNEGRKQKHCVYSYVSYCVSGTTSIFSLRGYRKFKCGTDEAGNQLWSMGEESSRVTMEVRRSMRTIVQIRGNLNRLTNDEETRIIKLWSGEKGLTINRGY